MPSNKLKDNKARHYVNQSLGNIELFSGSFSNYVFKPHFHRTYTIIFVEGGAADYASGNNSLVIPSGRLVVFNPFEVHAGKKISKLLWKFKTMYVPEVFLKKAVEKIGGKASMPFFNQKEIFDEKIFNKGLNIFPNLVGGKEKLDAESLLIDFLGDLISKYAVAADEKESAFTNVDFKVVSKVKSYIHDNYLENFSIAHLVQLTGYDEFKLIKKFKYYYNLPPHQYLLNLRIEKGKELLLNRHSLTEVAYTLGFFDQSHFIRHFKKINGITPKQFASRVNA